MTIKEIQLNLAFAWNGDEILELNFIVSTLWSTMQPVKAPQPQQQVVGGYVRTITSKKQKKHKNSNTICRF